MERAKRNAMRRRGLDPRALKKPVGKKGEKKTEESSKEAGKEEAAEVTEKIEKLGVVEEQTKTVDAKAKKEAVKPTKKVEEKPKATAGAAMPKKAGEKKKRVAKK